MPPEPARKESLVFDWNVSKIEGMANGRYSIASRWTG
jgi:hypothetical protein